MSRLIMPGTRVDTYKDADSDFDSDITPNTGIEWSWRKIYCIGGTQVVFVDMSGNEVTVLAADYAAINNQAIYIKTIKSTTDCATLYASA